MSRLSSLCWLLLVLVLAACQQSPTEALDPSTASSFTLVDAETNKPIKGHDPIRHGAELVLEELPSRQLNIVANVSAGSVVFKLNGKVVRTENFTPYALAGDHSGDYLAWTPGPGAYTLTAIPYSSSDAGGEARSPLTLDFTVVETANAPQPNPQPGDDFTPDPQPTDPQPSPDACAVIALEAEDLPLSGAWQVQSDAGASGGAYITWLGLSPEQNNNEPDDVITVPLEITEVGSYRFTWAMRQPDDVAGDKANDSWLNFPDAARFGSTGGDSYGGFVKVYGNGKGSFAYGATADQGEQKSELAIDFSAPGTYTMQLAGRSHGHQIDRVVLYRDSVSQEEAIQGDACQGSVPTNPEPTDPTPDPEPAPSGNLGPAFSYGCSRLAWSADGNQYDPDDLSASPLALLLLAARGQQQRLVHFDHSSNLGDNNPAMEEQMIWSVEEAARVIGGFDMSNIYNDQRDLEGSTDSVARAINASSAQDRLCFVVAGPHGVAYRGIAKAQRDKLPYVTMISHSEWNNSHDAADNIYNLDDIKRDFPELNFQAISDQNSNLGTRVGEEAWAWMKTAGDPATEWVGTRIDEVDTSGDVSDAGMMYYVLTGDENGDPSDVENYLRSSAPTQPNPDPDPEPDPNPEPDPMPTQPGPGAISLTSLTSNLAEPTSITHAGDGSGRLFVTQKGGELVIIQNGQVLGEPFLDLSDQVATNSERGLLDVAFHPNYAENGRLFVHYSDLQGDTVVAEYSVSGNPNAADAGSERVLLTASQPDSNHNGGELAFGPDGYLYIALGDGGPEENAQDLSNLLGAILRIDINSGAPYSVPADNPFVNTAGVRPEIWVYGLRNPWRFSFDREGNLFIGDVGQNAFEEINFQPASSAGGENYGWNQTEGTQCYLSGCDTSRYTLPILEYSHSSGVGRSITGGYRYDGSALPGLVGVYFYGDFASGNVWGAVQGADGAWSSEILLETDGNIVAFGEDGAGNIYLADFSGTLYQITGGASTAQAN